MRLIDADTLMEAIEWNTYPIHYDFNSVSQGISIEGLRQVVNEQPTAYDAEKVVSKLQEIQSRYSKEDLAIRGVLEKAIEIVKRGGTE